MGEDYVGEGSEDENGEGSVRNNSIFELVKSTGGVCYLRDSKLQGQAVGQGQDTKVKQGGEETGWKTI